MDGERPLGAGPSAARGWADSASGFGRELGAWLAEPERLRRSLRWLLPALLVLGLVLPPVSLPTRLATWDYSALDPGRDASAAEADGPASFVVSGRAITRPARLRLREDDGALGRLPALPAGHEPLTALYRLDLAGPAPRQGDLELPVRASSEDQPFIDGYAWDGQRWRWLAPRFVGTDRLRLSVPLASFVPQYLIATRATEAATQVAATLLPPPASVPAAMAELPILERRGYHLARDDGSVTGQRYALPSRQAAVYAVVDNLEGTRVRSDLVNNMLTLPRSRQRHREALVDLVRRDGLSGVVLDYRGIDSDLQPVYAGFVGRLAQDLHRAGAELVVMVPMPHTLADTFDGSPYNWRELAAGADALRIALPNDTPLETDFLDRLVRWALGSVERSKLQLAVPVIGRDKMAEVVSPITYGEALRRILDMAAADAPARVSPGSTGEVDLPTVRQSGLGRDVATKMWRFQYWDGNRREHTVWLNDAAGLQPAFDIAARYRLGRLALDGVSADLDPGIWRMVKDFLTDREATAPATSYRLRWELLDGDGRVLQQADQALEDARFQFQAPEVEADYRLRVSLIGPNDRVAAVGDTVVVAVAPPPLPTPIPMVTIVFEPTAPPVITAPAPGDEARLPTRAPVRVGGTAVPKSADYNATVTYAEGPLRSLPTFQGSQIVTDLRIGDRLLVIGATPDGGWYHAVHAATGVEGWVRNELVSLEVPLGDILRVTTAPAPGPASTP